MWSTSLPRGWKGSIASRRSARASGRGRGRWRWCTAAPPRRAAISSAFSAFSGFDASAPVAFFSLPLPSAVSLPGRGVVVVSGAWEARWSARGDFPRPPTALRGERALPPTRGASDGASGGGARRVAGRKQPPPPEATAEFCFVRSDRRKREGPVARTLHPGSRAAPWLARSPSRRKDSRTGRAAAVSSRTGAPVGLVSIRLIFPIFTIVVRAGHVWAQIGCRGGCRCTKAWLDNRFARVRVA